jgi:hypothetical protein
MTTPAIWAVVSPVTEEVRGEHTDRPAVLGTTFVDVLRLGPDLATAKAATAEVDWTVSRHRVRSP